MRFQRSEIAPFRCEVEPRRDAVHLHPIGELDLATAPLVEEKLIELANAGFERLVLDLRGLQFVDSTGLRLILAWHTKACEDGFHFGLVRGSVAVQRLFELTGTTHLNFADPCTPTRPSTRQPFGTRSGAPRGGVSERAWRRNQSARSS